MGPLSIVRVEHGMSVFLRMLRMFLIVEVLRVLAKSTALKTGVHLVMEDHRFGRALWWISMIP